MLMAAAERGTFAVSGREQTVDSLKKEIAVNQVEAEQILAEKVSTAPALPLPDLIWKDRPLVESPGRSGTRTAPDLPLPALRLPGPIWRDRLLDERPGRATNFRP